MQRASGTLAEITRRCTDIALQTDNDETTLGGRYRLLRRVGAGGMGTVWEAEDAVLKRRVAVKILAPSLCENPAIAARFELEAQAAGRLTHPNIAQVFDYGTHDGCPHIVLELVPGSTLRQLLGARGRLPPDEVAAIGAQIADALAVAHAEGIVHRDVKPANVMLAPDGRVKVMDFGIADAVWFEPITDTGTFMATAKYVSPEQATGGAVTAVSDVYSMGVVLHELLAGRPPFDGESPYAVAHAHAHDVPPPLVRLAPDAPPRLLAAVEAAMRKDPRLRPTASEVSAALRDVPSSGQTDPLPLPADAAARPTPAAPGAPTKVDVAADADSRSRRRALWILAGVALLAIVLSLALTAFSAPGDRAPSGRDPRTLVTRGASPRPTDAGTVAPAGDASGSSGPSGKAVGHDPAHGGPGNGGRSDNGNDGHGSNGHSNDG